MVSIKNLLFISLLVLFCLAEIVPEEAAPAEAIESADESHADEGSDQESTEAAAEQIASDATENQEGAVDSLSDEGKIGSSIFGGGYSHHSFFRGGRRFKFHRYRNKRIAPIQI